MPANDFLFQSIAKICDGKRFCALGRLSINAVRDCPVRARSSVRSNYPHDTFTLVGFRCPRKNQFSKVTVYAIILSLISITSFVVFWTFSDTYRYRIKIVLGIIPICVEEVIQDEQGARNSLSNFHDLDEPSTSYGGSTSATVKQSDLFKDQRVREFVDRHKFQSALSQESVRNESLKSRDSSQSRMDSSTDFAGEAGQLDEVDVITDDSIDFKLNEF